MARPTQEHQLADLCNIFDIFYTIKNDWIHPNWKFDSNNDLQQKDFSSHEANFYSEVCISNIFKDLIRFYRFGMEVFLDQAYGIQCRVFLSLYVKIV